MVKEDTLMLSDLDIPMEEYANGPGPPPPMDLVDLPDLSLEQMKDWIFAVPTLPDLHAVWEEGERIRLEMEQLAREREQAIIAAKIAAWEHKRERLQESIVDRRHAEGFADGLMGEAHARANVIFLLSFCGMTEMKIVCYPFSMLQIESTQP
ncbi:hypothetical protein R1flu_014707 [Riccia fluitans]|uniref:Uncharacterized protein n=1 Tax=Riccia fluitans TaxID=41844 RepID=A0ABD1YH87_9MARC